MFAKISRSHGVLKGEYFWNRNMVLGMILSFSIALILAAPLILLAVLL